MQLSHESCCQDPRRSIASRVSISMRRSTKNPSVDLLMHKLVVLYPHPTSPDKFRRYYTDTHLLLAKQLPGLRASRHTFEVKGIGAKSPYFCIWEGDFDSVESMGQAMNSPDGQKVSADVPNYATGGAVVLHYEAIAG